MDYSSININSYYITNSSFNLFTSNSIFSLYAIIVNVILALFFVFFLFCLSLIGSNFFVDSSGYLKSKPFECGFNPIFHNTTVKLTLHYFKIVLVFLIFDLEILFFFPWLVSAKFFLFEGFFSYFFSMFTIFMILFFGLLYEYLNNLLDWEL